MQNRAGRAAEEVIDPVGHGSNRDGSLQGRKLVNSCKFLNQAQIVGLTVYNVLIRYF